VIAPSATQSDSNVTCDLESYKQRGWCRAELLAKVCGSGSRELYFVHGKVEELAVQLASWHSVNDSLFVFEGDFTNPLDKEQLVAPVLGLYSSLLKRSNVRPATQMQQRSTRVRSLSNSRRAFTEFSSIYFDTVTDHVLKLIHNNRARFFPKTHVVDASVEVTPANATARAKMSATTERELFGSLVLRMEQRVLDVLAQTPPSSRTDSSSTRNFICSSKIDAPLDPMLLRGYAHTRTHARDDRRNATRVHSCTCARTYSLAQVRESVRTRVRGHAHTLTAASALTHSHVSMHLRISAHTCTCTSATANLFEHQCTSGRARVCGTM